MGNSSLWKSTKNEFKRENFSLNFETNRQFLEKDPEEVLEYFHSTIWPCCNRFVYLVYRIAIAIYYTIWFIESIVRNAEYRAQNYIMSNKQKTNILHLHPWPLYMTSWSLTILFIHLWLSAFIVLYFYSIAQKSRLSSIFTYLFGPFSCSKVKDLDKHKPKRAKQADTGDLDTQVECRDDDDKDRFFIVRLYRVVFSKRGEGDNDAEKARENKTEDEPASPSVGVNAKSDDFTSPPKVIRRANSPKKDKKGPVKYNYDANEKLLEKKPSVDENLASSNPDNTNVKKSVKETYCVKKSLCENPSSSASDPKSRSHWIKNHVPGVILILIKTSWLLYNQIVISAIVVTVGYFTYVFITEIETEPTWFSEIGNYHRHGVNSIVAIVDIIILAYPVRIFHFVYTVAYGWLYALVTFLFWLQDPAKNIIYQEIDYNRPFTILACYIALTILTFVMQVVHFFAYKFKLFLRYEYYIVRENCF